jgi:hypothetical protein
VDEKGEKITRREFIKTTGGIMTMTVVGADTLANFANAADTKAKESFMQFGIYPGTVTDVEEGMPKGKPEVPSKIQEALNLLQGNASSLLVRSYIHYGKIERHTPTNPEQYAINGRKLDLVLCFQSNEEDLSGWHDFIRKMVLQYGSKLGSLQITEEANAQIPFMDGNFKNVRLALVEGVVTAKDEIRKQGLNVKVGFNSTPIFNPADTFWKEIGERANDAFYDALDYVGLDFFPDVFRRIAYESHIDAVVYVLKTFREQNLPTANIPKHIPIRITENGWATGPDRSYEKQAQILETNVRTIYKYHEELNITHYELFGLLDSDSSVPDFNYQFGIARDDYTPKLAFETYRKLIAELGK